MTSLSYMVAANIQIWVGLGGEDGRDANGATATHSDRSKGHMNEIKCSPSPGDELVSCM